ncbi:sugar-binding transcriptional regulator [Solibacillus sp. FSL K6-1126]|uniref:sugar-binding transcriptional regulator n=1 Tax=Solibacillus sp. FSL K6-1126 TaxID=2921463 RepID=UPI0030F5DDAA
MSNKINQVGGFLTDISFFAAERKLMPEIDALFQKRFRVLQAIATFSPIGRRALGEQLQMTERDIRNETTVLSEQQLILIQKKGMICTPKGYEVIEQLYELYRELSGIVAMEQQLTNIFGIARVIIVPGDAEQDETVKQQLGKVAAQVLQQIAPEKAKIAVTGGSSVASMKEYLSDVPVLSDANFIAARGGMGDEMTFQANTIVSKFSKRCGATYRTLFLPEHLSEHAYEAMKDEPIIREMIKLYEQVDIVIHGIGAAQEMALRRKSSQQEQQILEEKGAVAEAFGYYFNADGDIVHHLRTIGIQRHQVNKAQHVLAIAAGRNKAAAIQAYFKNAAPQTILITDEQTARTILKN